MKQIVLVKSLTEWSLSAMIDETNRGLVQNEINAENLAVGESIPGPYPVGASAGWLFSGDMAHVDQFILIGASQIRSEDLHAISKKSQRIYEKIYQLHEPGLNDLKRHTRLILQTLEFASGMRAPDPLPPYLAEGTFAAQYLLGERDLIPDLIPGVGLIDDAILIKRVFSRNEPDFMRLEMLLTLGVRRQL